MAQVSEHPLATLLQIWMMTDQMKREQAEKAADEVYKKTALEWKKKEFEADQKERERKYQLDLKNLGLEEDRNKQAKRNFEFQQGRAMFDAAREGKEAKGKAALEREKVGKPWKQARIEAGYTPEEIEREAGALLPGMSRVQPPAVPLQGMEAISQLLGVLPGMEPVGHALAGVPGSVQPPEREATLEDVYGQVAPDFAMKEADKQSLAASREARAEDAAKRTALLQRAADRATAMSVLDLRLKTADAEMAEKKNRDYAIDREFEQKHKILTTTISMRNTNLNERREDRIARDQDYARAKDELNRYYNIYTKREARLEKHLTDLQDKERAARERFHALQGVVSLGPPQDKNDKNYQQDMMNYLSAQQILETKDQDMGAITKARETVQAERNKVKGYVDSIPQADRTNRRGQPLPPLEGYGVVPGTNIVLPDWTKKQVPPSKSKKVAPVSPPGKKKPAGKRLRYNALTNQFE